jgi:hypothetical protein
MIHRQLETVLDESELSRVEGFLHPHLPYLGGDELPATTPTITTLTSWAHAAKHSIVISSVTPNACAGCPGGARRQSDRGPPRYTATPRASRGTASACRCACNQTHSLSS